MGPHAPSVTGAVPGSSRRRVRRTPVPNQARERAFWSAGLHRIVGVDEVGVAPTCGAVVAAAVIMPPDGRRIRGVRDSKVLARDRRELLAPRIRREALAVGVGAASVAEIDRLNIYHATHLAMRRAVARVGGHDHVLVDGLRIHGFEDAVGPYTAIVDGDALCYSIACASIVAKVIRDRMMTLLAARYPGYGWEHNCGYATREHRDAIRRQGLTPFHRRSFPTIQAIMAGEQGELGLLEEVVEAAAADLGDAPRILDSIFVGAGSAG
ncbi:MAG TPA: ribonuclease HII [Candidatus Limnocylindrales bacterium]